MYYASELEIRYELLIFTSLATLGQCPAGEFSFDGFRPCEPCPVGTYQEESGRTHCVQCNGGLLTRSTRSRSFSQCLATGNLYNSHAAWTVMQLSLDVVKPLQ